MVNSETEKAESQEFEKQWFQITVPDSMVEHYLAKGYEVVERKTARNLVVIRKNIRR